MFTYLNTNTNDLIDSSKELFENCLIELNRSQYEILSLIYKYGKKDIQDALNFYDEIMGEKA